MEEDYRDMLESKRFEIVQHLQIDRPFVFDYLRHKGVLDSEDCELIHGERTTSLKIGKFVDVLSRKGSQAYQHLLESLQLEHPILYEKLTGEEADATTSPIMTKLKKSFTGVGGPLGNSELEILTRHLERTYGDLHEMSRRFEQVVQRKKDIEEQLETTTSDLERHKEKVDFLEKKIDSGKSESMPSPSNIKWLRTIQCVESLRKDISDRDIYIIALQTNLMSTREEIETLKRKNDNILSKNDELQKMMEEMSESYQKKKCESLRLSERIERQGNEIKKAEQTMRKYREVQFHNMRLREERDHLQEELDELKKWTEALKTRYDIVEYEKKKTLCDHTEIMADYGSLQEEMMKCREEMNEAQLLAADLRERVRHLEHDKLTYKRQRDGALTARRESILDRDKAFLERDQAVKKYDELKSTKEATIESKILQLKSYDEAIARSDVLEEEVKQVKINLRQTERELEEMKVKCGVQEEEEGGEEEEKNKDVKDKQDVNVPEIQIINSEGETSGNMSEENETVSRGNSAIVESIKRRVGPPTPTFSSYEPIFSAYNSLPNYGAFPPVHSSMNLFKESGFHRNRITRMPIKLRQNNREDGSSESSPEDKTSALWISGKEGVTQPEQGVFEDKGDETSSSSSKIINYL